jgi:hypothetical protein
LNGFNHNGDALPAADAGGAKTVSLSTGSQSMQ